MPVTAGGLKEVVLLRLVEEVSREVPKFGAVLETGGVALAEKLVETFGDLSSEGGHKVRAVLDGYVCYGYDFSELENLGIDALDAYTQMVARARLLSGIPHLESFISSGVEDNKFGWYITHF